MQVSAIELVIDDWLWAGKLQHVQEGVIYSMQELVVALAIEAKYSWLGFHSSLRMLVPALELVMDNLTWTLQLLLNV